MHYKNKYYKYKKKYLNLKQNAGSSTQKKIEKYIDIFQNRRLNENIQFKGLIILAHGGFIKDTNIEKKYKYILPFGDFKGKVLMINYERQKILSELLNQKDCKSLRLDYIENTISNTISNLELKCLNYYNSLFEKELKNIKKNPVLGNTTNIIKNFNTSDEYLNNLEEIHQKLFKYSPENPERIYKLYKNRNSPFVIDSSSEYIMNDMIFTFNLKGDGIYVVYCNNNEINIDIIENIDENFTLLDLENIFDVLLIEKESFIIPISCTNYLN